MERYPRSVRASFLVGVLLVSVPACRNDGLVTDELITPLCEPGDPFGEIGYEHDGAFVELEGDPAVVPMESSWNAVGLGLWFRLKGPAPQSVHGVFSWYVQEPSDQGDGEDVLVGELPFVTDLVCEADGTPVAFPLQLRIGVERKGTAENYVDDPGRIRLAVGAAGRLPEDCPLDGSDPQCIVADIPVVYTSATLVFAPE